MNSILEDLFNGKIFPYDNLIPKDPGFPELAKNINNTENYLRSLLSDMDKATIEKLIIMRDDLSTMENLETFSRGFRLAFMLVVDVYHNKGDSSAIQSLCDLAKSE